MARTNDEVAALLAEYADLLAITGGDAYRSRVYEKAARSVGGYSTDLSRLAPAELRRIPNVGSSIADKITEYLATGSIAALEELRARVPAGVRQLTAIGSLGPKRALLLHQELGIASVAELTDAIREGKLRDLPGFGRKTEENILRAIEVAGRSGRVQLDVALQSAEEVISALAGAPGCARVCYAGSLRRMRETIGDLDILAAYPDRTGEDAAPAASSSPASSAAASSAAAS